MRALRLKKASATAAAPLWLCPGSERVENGDIDGFIFQTNIGSKSHRVFLEEVMSSRNKLFLKPIDVEDFTNKGCDQPHASHQSLFHLRSFNRVDSRGGWFGYVRMVLPKKKDSLGFQQISPIKSLEDFSTNIRRHLFMHLFWKLFTKSQAVSRPFLPPGSWLSKEVPCWNKETCREMSCSAWKFWRCYKTGLKVLFFIVLSKCWLKRSGKGVAW